MSKLIQEMEELSQNLPFVKKDFVVGDDTFRTYNYLYQYDEMFSSPASLEMRGLTINVATNEIVSRPLHKFFNLGEKNAPNIEGKIIMIQEKVDGSMLHPLIYHEDGKEKIIFKTKMSPYSEVAVTANKWIQDNISESFIKMNLELLHKGITPIYEFYHPKHQIVVKYSKPFIKLLALRENETGKYIEFITPEDLISIVGDYPFIDKDFIPKRFPPTNDAIKWIKSEQEMEGVVVVTDTGNRYKVKTAWYLERHKAYNLTPHQVFLSILDATIDDVKAYVVDQEKMKEIEEMERIIYKAVDELTNIVKQGIENTKGIEKREAVNIARDISEKHAPFSQLVFGAIMKGNTDILSVFKKAPEKWWKVFREEIIGA